MKASPRPAWLAVLALLIVPGASLAWWLLRSPISRAPRPAAPLFAAPSVPSVPSREAPPPPDHTEEFAIRERADSRRKVEEAGALARTDPKRRRALLREALASDPKYEPALEQLSLALLHDENHDEARAVSARCLAVSPDNDTCRMVSDYALLRGPETDRVGQAARACLEGTPNDPKCLATTIGYDVLTGKIDEATRLVGTLDEVAPGAKQTLFAKARVESVAGHYDDARHDLEEACRQGLEQACFRAEALRGEGW